MAIKIIVSDLVTFKVAGFINSENGTPEPFDFRLTAKRFKSVEDIDELRRQSQELAIENNNATFADVLLRHGYIRGWAGVKGPDGAEMPFSEDNFRALMAIPGVTSLVRDALYLECGAKAKN